LLEKAENTAIAQKFYDQKLYTVFARGTGTKQGLLTLMRLRLFDDMRMSLVASESESD